MPALLGDCAASGGAAMPRATATAMSVLSMTLLGSDRVILEVTGAVCLRPQADVAGYGRAQHRVVFGEEVGIRRGAVASRAGRGAERVFDAQLSVDRNFDVRTVHIQLQLVVGGAI